MKENTLKRCVGRIIYECRIIPNVSSCSVCTCSFNLKAALRADICIILMFPGFERVILLSEQQYVEHMQFAEIYMLLWGPGTKVHIKYRKNTHLIEKK